MEEERMSSDEESVGVVAKRPKTADDDPATSAHPTGPIAQVPLPDEVVVKILLAMPLRERIRMEGVCRHWKDLLIPRSFENVTELKMEEFVADDGNRHWLLDPLADVTHIFNAVVSKIGGRHVVSLNLQFGRNSGALEPNIAFGVAELALVKLKCPNLRELTIPTGSVRLTPAAAMRLGAELSTIESFKFFGDTFNDSDEASTHLKMVVTLMPNLRQLEVDRICDGQFLHDLYVPTSLVGITIGELYETRMVDLEKFLVSHPALKRFYIRPAHCFHDHECGFVDRFLELLAKYRAQLECLRIGQCYFTPRERPTPPLCAVRAIASLTQLKQLHLDNPKIASPAMLESVYRNCPLLEDLSIQFCHCWTKNNWGPAGFAEVWRLTRLKRLQLVYVPLTAELSTRIFEAVGEQLEYLRLTNSTLSDASLLQIGLHCSSLVRLDLDHGGYGTAATEVTSRGMAAFIDAVTGHPSFHNGTRQRPLHIHLGVELFRQLPLVNLHKYQGKIELHLPVAAEPPRSAVKVEKFLHENQTMTGCRYHITM